LNSSSSIPNVEALIILKPSNITTRTNNPLAIASTTNHKLKTLAFVAIVGVEFVNEFNASMNGMAAVSIIFWSNPITALINISTKLPEVSEGLISVIIGVCSVAVLSLLVYVLDSIDVSVPDAITITSPIKAFLIIVLA
jgi:hypothetical protein